MFQTGCSKVSRSRWACRCRGVPDRDPNGDGCSTSWVWPARITSVHVEDRGILRSTVRLEGTIGPPSGPTTVIARIQFFAGSAAMRIAITLRNPRRAHHPGGIWELGDRGSVYFKDAAI